MDSYPPSPRFASSLSACDLPEGLQDPREPTIAQLLQEKALFSFSEWPKVPPDQIRGYVVIHISLQSLMDIFLI